MGDFTPFPGCVGDASPDSDYMKEALLEANIALREGEVPVGAAVVHGGKVIARGRNRREGDGDPLAHAEIFALRAAAKALGDWRLTGCTLYVTLEPCAMCAAACVQAQLGRIVFGAFDPDFGACGSAVDLTSGLVGKDLEVIGGVYEKRCSKLLTDFFKARRRVPKD